jgi:hypothetical protein
MGMNETAEKLRDEREELFKDGLSSRQIWFIVKAMKAARLYCRSNAAFNNFMNSMFQGAAKFRQVEKENVGWGKYMGLSITMLNSDGTTKEEIDTDTEEK